MADLQKKLQQILNSESAENGSNTPDFILAQFMLVSLAAFDAAVLRRETWYGRDARPGMPISGVPLADNPASAAPAAAATIYEEIVAERARQDAKWGGPAHDDRHSIFDWRDFIHEHTRRAALGLVYGEFRSQMVRVAALAVAAIESHDRGGGAQQEKAAPPTTVTITPEPAPAAALLNLFLR